MSHAERILEQGQALVRAIKALEAIVAGAPGWRAEEVLSASQAVGEDRAAAWLSGN